MNNLIQCNDDWTSTLVEMILTLIREHATVNVYQDGHYKSSGRLIEVKTSNDFVYMRLGTLNECCLNYQFNIENVYQVNSSVTPDGLKIDIVIEKGY
jgi:hypothetical protein